MGNPNTFQCTLKSVELIEERVKVFFLSNTQGSLAGLFISIPELNAFGNKFDGRGWHFPKYRKL
jgi:hypothetical protein